MFNGQGSFRLWLPLAMSVGLARAAAAETPGGAQIYQARCAPCHGASGEGVKDEYARPLVGERSLDALTRLIEKTMPADDPQACVGEEAARVAAFVFESFYSKAAQARLSPPRVELARLTVRQYRNAVADLVGSFSEQGTWKGERGLQGEYFKSRHPQDDKRAFERHDAAVDFHFGEAGPDAEKIDAKEFCVRWRGSLLAPETGDYEFTVKTENAARLWVNDDERPLIDAWVRSGSETEHRGSIRLLAGRAYPLKLVFFKSKDGKEKTASVSLLWKPPQGANELVPARYLSPSRFPDTLVVQTPFPPDDRSTGYERGTSVSKAWDEATTYAALETAGYVVGRLRKLSGISDDAPDRAERLRQFCRQFVERAFRQPLTDEQRAFFVDRYFDKAADTEGAVKRVVLLALKSPRFLYREPAAAAAGQFDVAARLSFGLWDSLPDRPLWDAAAAGQLGTPEMVAAQAQRMLGDERTRAKLRDFFHQWLKVDQLDPLRKDSAAFPEFDEQAASDLRQSLDLFLDDVVWSEASDFRQLLLADTLFLNGRLAKLYGVELPADAPFQKLSLDPAQRAGLLSHPFLMARFAYQSTSSPIHRGVFVVRSLLGRQLRPPPEAAAPLSPDLHPDLTTRERITLQTSPAACTNCHGMINPLGFTLEHYDALGRFRSEEKGRLVDDAGSYETLAGEKFEFHGARELAVFLAGSEETHAAFVEQLFHYLVKQPVRAYGVDRPERLRKFFEENGCNIRRLVVEMMVVSALR